METLTIIVKMAPLALLPIIMAAMFYLLINKTGFGKIKYIYQQIIVGVLFGALAVLGTEYGIDIDGALINTRDTAALSAGLIFGPYAGIIAGVIGGVERWFAVYWGAGEFTRLACTISTIFAGIAGALCRKFFYNNKPPKFTHALFLGISVETFHMLMIFICKMNEVSEAYGILKVISLPMIFLNGISVMLAVGIINIFDHKEKKKKTNTISDAFQRWLLIVVVITFFITAGFFSLETTNSAVTNVKSLLSTNINDIEQDIRDGSESMVITTVQLVKTALTNNPDYDLKALAEDTGVSEISIVDSNGIITKCSNEKLVNYDFKNDDEEAKKEYLSLVNSEQEIYVQNYDPFSTNQTENNIEEKKYVGIRYNDGFLEIGYDKEAYIKLIKDIFPSSIRNRHIGETGYIAVVNEDGTIESVGKEFNDLYHIEGENISKYGISISDFPNENTLEKKSLEGDSVEYFCMYVSCEGNIILASIPVEEAMYNCNLTLYIFSFLMILVFSILYFLILILIKNIFVKNLHSVNHSLRDITEGNLDVVVNTRKYREFSHLSDDINATVSTLNHYIEEAKTRIDAELEMARKIQTSSLSKVFPNNENFELYADMHTAKEVGGDFYDFSLIDKNHLAFLIADVSGKGIPAAMFMMTTKTLIKSLFELGYSTAEVLEKANDEICKKNDADMFVTVWAAILDLKTGNIQFANAGHNPPIIKHDDGSVEYIKSKPGFVLAGMEGIKYKNFEFQLQAGDTILLYTDGVTEATDLNNQLYSEERLIKKIADMDGKETPKEIVDIINSDIEKFVGKAPQFDDITMVSIKFKKIL